jgi:hypothetical protein
MHTIIGNLNKSSNSTSNPLARGLHHGWSRLDPQGKANRQYVSEAAKLSAERGDCTRYFSELVRASPPKNGCIKTMPLRLNGFMAAAACPALKEPGLVMML